MGILGTLTLSVLRLLSERPLRRSRKGRHMKQTHEYKKNTSNIPNSTNRHYWQYVIETTWAGASGAVVACWLP